MNFFEVINSRRSVRKFTKTPVPDEVIHKALQAGLKAPNSSNLQCWEFYWVKSPEKKSQMVKACLSQGAAKTANHLIVAVSRLDVWRRNRDLLIQDMQKTGSVPKIVQDYYFKLIPFLYIQDPLGILAAIKYLVFNIVGLFKPMPRKPVFRSELFEIATKSAALACENFMLAITAQGYGSCPMEGFDEKRVKRILNIKSKSHIVMVIGVGDIDSAGIFGPQYRVDSNLVVHEV